MDTSDKQQKKKQPQPQKPRLIDTKWVGTIMPVSFALSVAMSYMSNEALNSAGTLLSCDVLLSGLGFECTGVSIAHGLEAGFHVLPIRPLLHGTGVGYCTLVQLIVQKDPRFEEIFRFCKDVGLPVCTADIGLTEENRQASIEALVDEVYGKRWNVSNVPMYFSRETLLNAILYLDAYAADHA